MGEGEAVVNGDHLHVGRLGQEAGFVVAARFFPHLDQPVPPLAPVRVPDDVVEDDHLLELELELAPQVLADAPPPEVVRPKASLLEAFRVSLQRADFQRRSFKLGAFVVELGAGQPHHSRLGDDPQIEPLAHHRRGRLAQVALVGREAAPPEQAGETPFLQLFHKSRVQLAVRLLVLRFEHADNFLLPVPDKVAARAALRDSDGRHPEGDSLFDFSHQLLEVRVVGKIVDAEVFFGALLRRHFRAARLEHDYDFF